MSHERGMTMNRETRRAFFPAAILLTNLLLCLFMASPSWAAVYFTDDMESAGSWTAQSPWAQTSGDSHSGANAWTDSPGAYYGNQKDLSLTQSASVSLAGATNPQLVFWHKYQIEQDFDFGHVELSTDGGANWPTRLASFSGISGWKREQIDLTFYAGQTDVRIRFRLVTDKNGRQDGWTIDDMAIAEPPVAVATLTVSNPTASSLDLSWTKNLDTDFAAYKIYRSTAAGVTTGSTLVTTITANTQTTYPDSGLVPGTTYYYRIYVTNTRDLYTGSREESGTTAIAAYTFPFFDDMEHGVGGWTAAAPWELTNTDKHSGSYCWTDSPAGSYAASTDKSLEIKVDLGPAIMPVLSFWHRYTFDPNSDFGYVEVKEDGTTTWYRIYFITGTQAAWTEERINLSSYAGKKISVRFRIVTDNNTIQSDGWYIDDVRIDEPQNLTPPAGPIAYPFRDNMETTATAMNWHSSSWALVADAHSGTYAFTDSPAGNYGENVTSELVMANSINLSGAVNPQLSFWHKYSIVSNESFNPCGWTNEYDYGKVFISTNNGQAGTWRELASYKGSSGWKQEKIDLSTYAGLPNVRIKFAVIDNKTGNGGCTTRSDGWTIDDVILENAPINVTLSLVSSSMNSVDLSWTANTDLDFDHYELYRSTSPGVTRTSTPVASVSPQSKTTYTDAVAMVQPETYYYRIWVVDVDGNVSIGSNEVHATYTLPVNGYPFAEDGEGGTAKWSWGSPWGIVTVSAALSHAGLDSKVWTTSPGGGNYPNNANTALSTFVNLSAASTPVLSFWHKYSLEQGKDFIRLEVSIDDGETWTPLRSFTGTETLWSLERVNLSPYAGQAKLGLRFLLTSDGANSQSGWQMDDLNIKEETVQAAYAFQDDMEGLMKPWFYDSPWGLVTLSPAEVRAGPASNVWTDSPEGAYAAGADTSLQLSIDLGSAGMPVLSFWHKYAFETNLDFGYVEVREGAASPWRRLFFVTGTSSWTESRVDLSNYAGKQIDLRFRVVADNNGVQSDGWHIDDIRIAETDKPGLPYPFKDNLEDSSKTDLYWHRSSWASTADPHYGNISITDSKQGNYGSQVWSELIMANTLNLGAAVHPQLTFWHKYSIVSNDSFNPCGWTNEYDYGRVYLSTNKGQPGTWVELANYKGSQTTWKREQIDLSAWAGLADIRIRFVMNDNKTGNGSCSTQADGWTLDDITVENAPVDVPLSITTSSMSAVALSWTASPDTDFDRYEIYRSTTPGVTRGSTLVKTVSVKDVVAYTDTVAINQPGTYYYRLWVYDTDGNVSMGSNEMQATYSVPVNVYPFSEDGEGGTAKWSRGAPWGLTDTTAYNGSYAWTDSPGTNYDANANTSLTTFLNLSGSIHPVLTFWHQYSLETGKDFVHLEVSTDNGQSWTELRSYTGTETTWNQERINLTPYTGNAKLGLRFRLTSDGANQQDGWFMDDMNLKEEATAAGYPFFDDMEHGPAPWFYDSPWGLVTLSPSDTYSGAASTVWTDSPGGSYAPGTDSSLYLTVDLGSAKEPVLSFWHKYAFDLNSDFGYLEVKESGATAWTRLFFATGTSPAWVQSWVDLANYAGKQVTLRFRVVTDTNGIQSDGWSIDDIRIEETKRPLLSYPFVDDLDGTATATNWFTSSWDLVSGGRSGFAFTDSPVGNYGNQTWNELVMSNTIDLRGAVHPQLSFWHKYSIVTNDSFNPCGWTNEYDYGRVYLSTYNGQPGTWRELANFKGTQSTWKEEKIDLGNYIGLPNVRIKFVMNDNKTGNGSCSTQAAGWTLDDIRLGEDLAIPSFIQKSSGDGQTGQTGTALAQPFVVQVNDADSRTQAGIDVDFAVGGGGGTLSAPSATTASNGRASVLLTLGTVSGVNTVSATIRGTSQTVVFSATGYATGQAMRLAKISGDNQVNAVGLSLANPLVVRVTDISGSPVAGESVSFSKILGDGTLSVSDPVTTDGSGYASCNLTLGTATGMITVTATSTTSLIGSPVTFTAYAVQQGGALGDTDGDGIPDAWETAHGLNPNDKNDAALDPDNDGLTNIEEYIRGTNPNKADTDNDGMPDGWEVRYRFNPLDASDAAKDANRDGVTNLQHFQANTVPVLVKHFTIAGATSESMAIYGTATINGIPLTEGDEVAVLDPQGVVCGQYTVTTPGQYGFMHVYKDDPATTTKDEGAQSDDVLTFRIWNAAEKVELDVVTDVVTGTKPPSWTRDGDLAQINLTGSSKYRIPLHTGWNLISFPIKTCYYADSIAGYADGAPTGPMLPGTVYQKVAGINEVFSSISGQYDVVRSFDHDGAHTFDPALPGFSDMKYIAGGYGYWIKMKSPGHLEVSGLKASAGDALPLRPEWNLVGYWHPEVNYTGATPSVDFPAGVTQFTAVANIDAVLTAVSGNYWVVRTFDSNGAHTFDPLLGTFNDLNYLGPGYGMWIKMKAVDQLSY